MGALFPKSCGKKAEASLTQVTYQVAKKRKAVLALGSPTLCSQMPEQLREPGR